MISLNYDQSKLTIIFIYSNQIIGEFIIQLGSRPPNYYPHKILTEMTQASSLDEIKNLI